MSHQRIQQDAMSPNLNQGLSLKNDEVIVSTTRVTYPCREVSCRSTVSHSEMPCTYQDVSLTTQARGNKSSSSPAPRTTAYRTTRELLVVATTFILLLTLLMSPGCQADCSLRRFVHTVRWKRCIPKRIGMLACHRSSCRNSTKPITSFPTILVRACTCCKETESRERLVPLRCPHSTGYRRVNLPVKVPTGCGRTPCDPMTLI